MASQQIIDKVRVYRRKLQEEGIPVNEMYLFGSFATGLETDESDIDVMIVTDLESAGDDWKVGKMWRLTKFADTRIEPFVIDQARFQEDNISPVIRAVKREGVMIHL